MNLAELRGEIEAELQFGSNVQARRDSLTRVINKQYQQLCSEQRWEFLQKHATINAYGTDGQFPASLTIGSKVVTMSTTGVSADWLGHTFSSASQSLEASIVAVDVANDRLLLDTAAPANASVTDAVITFDRYILPDDLVDLLDIMSRADDRGQLQSLDLATEASMMLNDDDPAGSGPTTYMFEPQVREAAPTQDFTLGIAGATTYTTGSLTAATTYYYCYTWLHNGRESARSPIQSRTPDSGVISLLNLETDGSSSLFSTRRIYRMDGNTGVFRKLFDADGSTTGPIYDDGGATPDESVTYEDRGPRQYIRVWPKPASTSESGNTTIASPVELQLRYQFRPKRLVHDTDAPDIPAEHHSIIVHRVVEQLAARRGDAALAKIHQKLGDEQMKQMRRRYLTRTSRNWRRGLSTITRRFGVPPFTVTKL